MLIDVAIMHVVQMPIVQIVNMVAMLDGRMATSWAMHVVMVQVLGMRTSGHVGRGSGKTSQL